MRNGNYTLIKTPEGYPGKRYRGRYAYEHHVVWWEKTGEVAGKGFVIHHKNENTHDNRFENLEKKAWAKHSSDHQPAAEVVDLVCSWCGDGFQRKEKDVRFKRKKGQNRFYCCRSHQVFDQQRRKKSDLG